MTMHTQKLTGAEVVINESKSGKAMMLRLSWTGVDEKSGERQWGHWAKWLPKSQVQVVDKDVIELPTWLMENLESEAKEKFGLSSVGFRRWEATV